MKAQAFEAWLAAAPQGHGRCKACKRSYHDGHQKGCVSRQVPVLTSSHVSSTNHRFHPIKFNKKSVNRKLAPVGAEHHSFRLRPVALGPFCCSTYVAIGPTCPDGCRFKHDAHGNPGACFVYAGFTKHLNIKLERAARRFTPEQVGRIEACAIDLVFPRGVPQDGARGGRDLRLHVGGETPNARAARSLACSASGWRIRGGGAVWTYTHRWRQIPRRNFGIIAVWASVERESDVADARARGYPVAVTVDAFPNEAKPFRFGGTTVVPCPYETRGRTCVQCRLCLEPPQPFRTGERAIGFAVHGSGAKRLKRQLRVLRTTGASRCESTQ